jgi:hypothetical protein
MIAVGDLLVDDPGEPALQILSLDYAPDGPPNLDAFLDGYHKR